MAEQELGPEGPPTGMRGCGLALCGPAMALVWSSLPLCGPAMMLFSPMQPDQGPAMALFSPSLPHRGSVLALFFATVAGLWAGSRAFRHDTGARSPDAPWAGGSPAPLPCGTAGQPYRRAAVLRPRATCPAWRCSWRSGRTVLCAGLPGRGCGRPLSAAHSLPARRP